MTEVDYIGTGFTFPMGVNLRGGLGMASGTDRIEQSIRIILSTALTERVMRPAFGCGVWDYVFSPINTATLSQIADATKEAITRWEPRVAITGITVIPDEFNESLVQIDLDYEVLPTNDRRNLVYPFYLIPRGEH